MVHVFIVAPGTHLLRSAAQNDNGNLWITYGIPFCSGKANQPVWDRNPWKLCQYHSWWCPGSIRRQTISSHDTGYLKWGCLLSSSVDVLSIMWRMSSRNCMSNECFSNKFGMCFIIKMLLNGAYIQQLTCHHWLGKGLSLNHLDQYWLPFTDMFK